MVVKEFVDPGFSGTSLSRPGLQEMLKYLEEEGESIDFLIVHKLDRLSRLRADEVALSTRISNLGIRLVSTSENIDESPGGMLLQGIMSSIAEFYSRNLANEVLKGMNEKVRTGGSVGRAPIGYLNVRDFDQGREVRTVKIDEERAPLVKWAFEAYAEGGWTIATLTEELQRRGLTTVPTPKMVSRPVQIRQIGGMLNNKFYAGTLTFKGAEYPGNHEPLIDLATFEKVQTVLSSKLTGERSRKHDHYLKSTVFCGNCGARLMYQRNRSGGNGELYEYYVCTDRHAKRNKCDFKAVQVDLVEKKIAELYKQVSLSAEARNLMEQGLKIALKHFR